MAKFDEELAEDEKEIDELQAELKKLEAALEATDGERQGIKPVGQLNIISTIDFILWN
jgi:hypothetical protein